MNATYGHCAINTRLNLTSKDNDLSSQIFVIGGEISETSVKTYCNIMTNHNMCKGEGPTDDFAWRDFEHLLEGRKGHSCTLFDHPTYGEIILVAHGWKTHSTEVLRVRDCFMCISECDQVCSWSNNLNGVPIEWIGYGSLLNSAMTTLNGIPTMFGGQYFDGTNWGNETKFVFELIDTSSEDGGNIEWRHLLYPGMQTSRQQHTAVAVPLSFLCDDEDKTSTER